LRRSVFRALEFDERSCAVTERIIEGLAWCTAERSRRLITVYDEGGFLVLDGSQMPGGVIRRVVLVRYGV
jgi:hypothetical protein